MDCYGTEDALDDCTHQNEDEENCGGSEAAGVICIAGSSSTTTTTQSSSPAGSYIKCYKILNVSENKITLLLNWKGTLEHPPINCKELIFLL